MYLFSISKEQLIGCLKEKHSYKELTICDLLSSGLLDVITQYKFIASLVITSNILSITKGLSIKLQGRAYDLVQAMSDIDETIKVLEDFRVGIDDDSRFGHIFEEIRELTDQLNVPPTLPRVTNRQQHRDFIAAQTPQDFYKRNLMIPFLDNLIHQLNTRYNIKNRSLIALFALVPSALLKLKSSDVQSKCFC